jgi:hypothetical protein
VGDGHQGLLTTDSWPARPVRDLHRHSPVPPQEERRGPGVPRAGQQVQASPRPRRRP